MKPFKTLLAALFVNGVISYEVNNVQSLAKKSRTPPITVQGNKFFYSDTGDQFFLRGIAYQPLRKEGEVYDRTLENAYLDPLANPTTCLRDLEYFQDLNINLVRVYHIDPSANHDVCMKAFSEAGIYVLADLSEPDLSINRDDPSWDTALFDRYKAVIDSFHKYNNILGFFAGNEVTTSKKNTNASPFVRAAVRDIKDYIRKKNYRKIPIGYATNDDAETRSSLSNYFVCGSNRTVNSIDFLGVNMYEWCGYSSYTTSGYRERTLEFKDYPVPVFFSEYGCNNVSPRPFTEVEALYGPTMSRVWSGGIAYSYFEGVNHYGIVQENFDGTVTKLIDYDHLKRRLNKARPVRINAKSIVTIENNNPVACQPQSGLWQATSVLPRTPDPGKCECLQSTLSCIVTPYKSLNEYELLNEVCTQVDCSLIQSDASSGEYGKFSDCSARQRLSFAINQYYIQNERNPSSCDLGGSAVLIGNNDNLDLAEVLSSDGRTCKEAIGDILEYNTVKQTAPAKSNTTLPKASDNSGKTLHSEKKNKTKLRSQAITIRLDKSTIYHQLRICFVLMCFAVIF
ncbi:Piso0_002847 [Millerozyma farinosa CBS 7064]|uniref:1,3-beta-glucanosyltransferase n=1 Tax=Pichia sorbitophila (strain ATCC MYA-4447 / BCRC 22081 / CBS 7064 / NBRC 10061 / NRRL Y-12695) TaxID=559304 RepID=G8YDP0_PICSO|nr:Piso0_002847 [Millerozyma farinosa CBS 7064]